MKKLFSCLYGSGLYGTKTPTSDRDVKHICLPSLDNLLLGKKVVNVANHTNNKANTRNGVDDVDEEFIPLQIFARDFMLGQTYALELAFAVDSKEAEQTFYDENDNPVVGQDPWDSDFGTFVFELRSKFLSSNIKAMMGYVVNQANLYSFKGERLNVAREFRELIALWTGPDSNEISIETLLEYQAGQNFKDTGLMFDARRLALKYPKYFKISEYDIGQDRTRPCFILLAKTIPHTMKIDHAITVIDSIINKYGARADAASDTNVDWKATMHALRIVDEGLNILSNHRLFFPFEQQYIDRLLAIKRGELPLADIKHELDSKLTQLKELELTTSLPAVDQKMREDFDIFMIKWLRKFYNLKD